MNPGPSLNAAQYRNLSSIRRAYIKPNSPKLNGKVERSHRFDGQEIYHLLSRKGGIDIETKLEK